MSYGGGKPISCTESIEDIIAREMKRCKLEQHLIDAIDAFAECNGIYTVTDELDMSKGYGRVSIELKSRKKKIKRLLKEQKHLLKKQGGKKK